MAAECSICYEIFGKENKEVVVTKCGHMFHHGNFQFAYVTLDRLKLIVNILNISI